MGDLIRRGSTSARRGGDTRLVGPCKIIVERAKDRIDDILVRAGTALHVDMRLLVRWAPFVREAFESRPCITIPELRAGVAARGSFGKDIDRRVEPDGDRPVVEKLASARIDIGTAPGGNHPDVPFIDQPSDQAPLSVAEIMFTVALENLCRRKARGIFDRGVAIDELQPKTPGEAAPHGRFSNPHQTDQNDRPIKTLAQFYHPGGYTAAHPLGKSARMSRIVVLIVLLVVIIGALVYLSTVPRAQPTHTIEVAVPPGGNAH